MGPALPVCRWGTTKVPRCFRVQRLIYEQQRLILILVSLVKFAKERMSIDLELRLFIGYLASILIFSDSGVPSQRECEFKDRLDVGGGQVLHLQRLLVLVDDSEEFHLIIHLLPNLACRWSVLLTAVPPETSIPPTIHPHLTAPLG